MMDGVARRAVRGLRPERLDVAVDELREPPATIGLLDHAVRCDIERLRIDLDDRPFGPLRIDPMTVCGLDIPSRPIVTASTGATL
jgi:hypothetical protein